MVCHFFAHGEHFVTGKVHAMDICQAILALKILHMLLEFPKGSFIVLQINKPSWTTLPMRLLDAFFWVPWVLVTSVFPVFPILFF